MFVGAGSQKFSALCGLGKERSQVAMELAVDETLDVYKKIGGRLRSLRKSRGLTQAQIAEIISVSPQQYQKYEDAHSKCNLNYLVKLAAHFEVPLGAFLNDLDETAFSEEEFASSDADLLARLVSSYVGLNSIEEKLRLVQLVEAMKLSQV